jgi:hypothetical protein
MVRTQVVPTTCIHCGARFAAPFQSIIDVGADHAIKRRFLQGQVNVAICPQCGNQGMVTAPFLYHDPDKEMALVFMPQNLQLHNQHEQRIIGELTNALLASLPAEKRKGYILQPKPFLSLPSLINEILTAEGITPEMVEAQNARMHLMNRFLMANDREELHRLAAENEGQLDYEFFEALTSSIEAAIEDGQTELARHLTAIRSELAQVSKAGREAAAQAAIGAPMTREALLDEILAITDQARLEALISAARPLLDYPFFQALTACIEKAQKEGQTEEAERLKKTRSRILDITAQLDKAAQVALQQAAELLKEVLRSQDPEKLLRERLEQINDAFFMILGANIQEAQGRGQQDVVEALQRIAEITFSLLEEQMPPEVRFINQLLQASYPDGTRQIMEDQTAMLTPQLLEMMEVTAQQLHRSGRPKSALRLEQIKEQAQTLLSERTVVAGR